MALQYEKYFHDKFELTSFAHLGTQQLCVCMWFYIVLTLILNLDLTVGIEHNFPIEFTWNI